MAAITHAHLASSISISYSSLKLSPVTPYSCETANVKPVQTMIGRALNLGQGAGEDVNLWLVSDWLDAHSSKAPSKTGVVTRFGMLSRPSLNCGMRARRLMGVLDSSNSARMAIG